MKIISLVGARPQFIKEAILNSAARASEAWKHILVHSGQHYDISMSDIFFGELGIPKPTYNLGVGSGTHAETTGAVLIGMEKILLAEKPDALIVYGDTNTTLGGALAASKLHIPIIHVEAGIRMLPRDMPEEINRNLTDRISTVFCCCSDLGAKNLERENLTEGVHVCGDIMLDVIMRMKDKFKYNEIMNKLGLENTPYIVSTIHRDYNVDDPEKLTQIISGLDQIRQLTGFRIVFPVHPRTKRALDKIGSLSVEFLDIIEPLGYLELMSLTQNAEFVITDSGGFQKEAYYSGKRALVLMPDTGWRELVEAGWNILCSPNAEDMMAGYEKIIRQANIPHEIYGNGQASEKIIASIMHELC